MLMDIEEPENKMEAQREEDEAEPEAPATQNSKPTGFTTFSIVLLSMTEGFNLGYMDSLMSIFRQRGVHSSRIGILTIMMAPFVLSFLGAPVVDKYYLPGFGKRKTYLVPCKFIIGIALFVFSFMVNQAVADERITFIAFYLFLVGLVQLFDFNALAGLRFELYGTENTGTAAFTLYAGILLGNLLSYQTFILLNSSYVCKDLLGISSEGLVTHQHINLVFSLCNVAAGVCMLRVDEPLKARSKAKMISVLRLMRVFLLDKVYRRATLWLMFSCFGAIALRSTIALQLIKKGMRREHIVMLLAANAVFNLLNNFLLKRFMKPGQIVRICSFFIVCYLLVMYIDLYNVATFDAASGYSKGLVLFYAGIFFEGAFPYISYQIGFMNYSTYPKYAASYFNTFMGLINLGKILPVSITVTLLDYMNYSFLFFLLNSLNILFIVLTFKTVATAIDTTPIETYNSIIAAIEPDDPNSEENGGYKK